MVNTTTWDNGRLVTPWRWEPLPVHGGWKVEHTRWIRTPDGWEDDSDELLRAHFASQAEAQAAADALNGALQ